MLDLLCELQSEANLTMIIATHDDKWPSARRTVQLVDGLIVT